MNDHVVEDTKGSYSNVLQASVSYPAAGLSFLQPQPVNQLVHTWSLPSHCCAAAVLM